MAPKSLLTKTKSQTFKQGTLSFASSKRTTSSNSVAKAKKTSQASKSITKRRRISDSSGEDVSVEDVEMTSEEEEETVEPEERKTEGRLPPRPVLRPRIPSDKQSTKPATFAPPLNNCEGTLQTEGLGRPELSPKDPRWRKHHAVVRKKMGYQHPIHSEGQNEIHEILRVFDLSYEYGPCIGVSRLDRWERAKMIGLNPPSEVYEILMTRQGTEQVEFSQCVFYDEV